MKSSIQFSVLARSKMFCDISGSFRTAVVDWKESALVIVESKSKMIKVFLIGVVDIYVYVCIYM